MNDDESEFSYEELKESIGKLSKAINDLLALFRTAAEDIKHEPASDLSEVSGKLDKLIMQNKEIAEGITLLLELRREQLPRISRQAPTQPSVYPHHINPAQFPSAPPRPIFGEFQSPLQGQTQGPIPKYKMQPQQPALNQQSLDFPLPTLPEEKKEDVLPDFGLPENLTPPPNPPVPSKKRRFI